MTNSCHGRDFSGACDPPDLEARRPQNRPALSAIRYRISRHHNFLARMVRAIPRETIADKSTGTESRPLRGLTTRSVDDPSIALADAFACSLDALAFYQERIANEGYIRTATERLSALELLRAIDYELRPGVAAAASLAFTVEDVDDPFRVVDVPVGTQVMSVPAAPDERPQIYETVETIQARAEWNAIPARTQRPQNLAMFWNPDDEGDAANGTLYLLDLDNGFDLDDADPADIVTIDASSAGDYVPLTPGLDLAAALADLAADAALNPAIEPVLKGLKVEQVEVNGIGLALDLGGRILAVGVRRADDGTIAAVHTKPFRIDGVEEDADYGLTRVQLGEIEESPKPPRRRLLKFRVPRLRIGRPIVQPVAFDARNASSVIGRASWRSSDLSAFVRTQAWSRTQVMRLFRQAPNVPAPAHGEANPGFYYLRQTVAFFGNGAPKWETLAKPNETRGGTGNDPYEASWEANGVPVSIWSDSQGSPLTASHAFLEREVPEAVPEGWTVFETPFGKTLAFRIARAATQSRADFALSGKTTGLSLRGPAGGAFTPWNGNQLATGLADFDFRTATARLASERLTLGGLPITDPLEAGGNEVTLDGLYLDLHPEVSVSIAGERADAPGIAEDETQSLKDVVHTGGFTRLTFAEGLAYSFTRTSVRVNGNVARATHGEAVEEPLGSGDATQANQAFTLAKPPLTFVAATTDSGAAATLQVRVDGIAWQEVPSLHDAGPKDEVYTLRIDDDGTSRVVFGDGRRGKRLPTGALNVRAAYRSGMGVAGQVGAGSLTLLRKRPLGVRAVVNPSPARGVAAAETLEDARITGPQSVRTLGRVVSRADYEDFARSFAGIGKAKASALWRGRRQIIHLTVSPAVEGVFDADDDTLSTLRAAIEERRDPSTALIVAPHVQRFFSLAANVAFDPRHLPDAVAQSVRAALMAAFGYAARPLAEAVSAAAVIATIQGVGGVDHVDLDALALYSDEVEATAATLAALLPALPARLGTAGDPPAVEPAELLTLLEAGIALTMERADA